jgi:serine O-acetyltransferase
LTYINHKKAKKSTLTNTINEYKSLIQAYKDKDPAARTPAEILLLYPGIHAVMGHRLAHFLHKKGFRFTARAISQLNRFITGVEIHPGAKIGKRLVIDHGMGVVIGETTEIGDDVLIYQGATLGGSGKEKGKRHPTIGNNVMIGAGACVLGSFKVGDNSRIAANAVVIKEVPENATAVGVPARIARIDGKRISYENELDQRTPDLVNEEIKRLSERIAQLEAEIESLKK